MTGLAKVVIHCGWLERYEVRCVLMESLNESYVLESLIAAGNLL